MVVEFVDEEAGRTTAVGRVAVPFLVVAEIIEVEVEEVDRVEIVEEEGPAFELETNEALVEHSLSIADPADPETIANPATFAPVEEGTGAGAVVEGMVLAEEGRGEVVEGTSCACAATVFRTEVTIARELVLQLPPAPEVDSTTATAAAVAIGRSCIRVCASSTALAATPLFPASAIANTTGLPCTATRASSHTASTAAATSAGIARSEGSEVTASRTWRREEERRGIALVERGERRRRVEREKRGRCIFPKV